MKRKSSKDADSTEYEDFLDEYEFGAVLRGLAESRRQQLRAYESRLLAFVDILGFGEAVRHMEEDSDGRADLLKAVRGLAIWSTRQPRQVNFISDQRVTCFSDSIVISYPTCPNPPLDQLIGDILRLTSEMIRRGFAIRGAIALGNLHHTPGIVVGTGLVEAHHLEQTCAVFPRVILSPNVMRVTLGLAREATDEQVAQCLEIRKRDAADAGHEYAGFSDRLIRDTDGCYFLDHLGLNLEYTDWSNDDLRECHEHLTSVRSLIQKNLREVNSIVGAGAEETARRRVKWVWYANYLNKAIVPFNKASRCKRIRTFSLNEVLGGKRPA